MQSLEVSAADIKTNLLEKNSGGQVAKSTHNFLTILQSDSYFGGVRFNVIRNNAEIMSATGTRAWEDADEAAARTYIESYYGLHANDKFNDALLLFFRYRRYNPIKDMIEAIQWDGENRCEHFLHTYGNTEDTPYTREVSRLIFAGGIHRLYRPGCKFDDVPIFIGAQQGEGKSSLVRFLALNDTYFGELGCFEGKESIEQLSGKWIMEIPEMLALTKTKEVEASKAYITRAIDQYRKPYDRNVSELPRRCIFIGTSNNVTPLRDVYNRRYYPVTLHTKGTELFKKETEIRDYIAQCWAEARERMKGGSMQCFAREELIPLCRQKQDEARQDDWREGAIETYLADKAVGDFVCIRELTNKALAFNGMGHDPSVIESKDIGMIMARFPEWERVGKHRFSDFGQQRAWQKTKMGEVLPSEADDFPF